MPGGMPDQVHVVSHGPHCLDGVAAAVAVARYYEGVAPAIARFAGNSEIDRVLRSIEPEPGRNVELWITDISWREPETDAHLRAIAAAGVRIFWIDHHRTALARFAAGAVDVPFAGRVLSEEFAASRLTYDYLRGRLEAEGRTAPRFAALAPLIAMADDNDRWLHRIPGSRELAWVVQETDWKKFRDTLVDSMTNFETPVIKVEDGDYRRHHELYLKHYYDGKPLDTDYTARTLRNIQYLWGMPVHLETVVDDDQVLLSYDGETFEQTVM